MLTAADPESRVVGALALHSMSTEQLAIALDLSPDTVRNVTQRLLAKGDVQRIKPWSTRKTNHRPPLHFALTPSAHVPFDFYREPQA